jgi:light-regulated signal transduction histidine kinase (bacteriophytochrome)
MQARDEVTTARTELDRWLYAAGHDLAEPARTIKGFLGLLERRHGSALDADAREFIGFAVDAANRLEVMLEALLEYGRIGKEPCPAEPVDLAAVLESVLAGFASRLEATGGCIEIGPLPAVTGSRKLWRRLLAILIDNALTYQGSEPPHVRIRGDRAKLTVADNGIGIDPRFFDRIFEPFQRLHSRDAIKGCGMGLAIGRRIAEHMGGTLDVKAGEAGGSIFVVGLPGAQPTP